MKRLIERNEDPVPRRRAGWPTSISAEGVSAGRRKESVEVLKIASIDAPSAPQSASATDMDQLVSYGEIADAPDNSATRTELRVGYRGGRECQEATAVDVEQALNWPKPIMYRIEHVPPHTLEAILVESFPLVEQPRLTVTSLCDR
jgi:hypothetical protein